METFFEFVDFHNTQVLVIGFSCLTLTAISFAFVWLYNRRRFHNLKHQIPASVVHNYIESIIQNSTALKSSLFRGLTTATAEGVREMHASVVPLSHLAGGVANEVGASTEEMNAKNAEIAVLKSQLKEKNSVLSEIEDKMKETSSDLKQALNKLKDAEANPKNSGSGNSAVNAELEKLAKERDELKNRLEEYGVIEDDLVNLKKLQQENEQLRRSLKIAPNQDIPKNEADDKEVVSQKAKNQEALEVEAKKTKQAEQEEIEAKKTQKNTDEEVEAKKTKKNETSETEMAATKLPEAKNTDGTTTSAKTAEAAPAGEKVASAEAANDDSQANAAPADNVIPFGRKEEDKNTAKDNGSVSASAAADATVASKSEDKPAPDVPEDLLSEFEKMLG